MLYHMIVLNTCDTLLTFTYSRQGRGYAGTRGGSPGPPGPPGPPGSISVNDIISLLQRKCISDRLQILQWWKLNI